MTVMTLYNEIQFALQYSYFKIASCNTNISFTQYTHTIVINTCTYLDWRVFNELCVHHCIYIKQLIKVRHFERPPSHMISKTINNKRTYISKKGDENIKNDGVLCSSHKGYDISHLLHLKMDLVFTEPDTKLSYAGSALVQCKISC